MLGVAAAATAGALLLAAASPAAAEGFFEMLFGLDRPPERSRAYIDPRDGTSEGSGAALRQDSQGDAAESIRGGSGPVVTYCVRSCDGRYFPITSGRGGAVEACNAFCPAARTAVFRGRGIDNATDARGRAYSTSDNAYVYRDRLIPGCTCDGKGPTGVAAVDIKDDPTLRNGDIVATAHGFVAYAGKTQEHQEARFTPIDASRALGTSVKRQLADTRIRQRATTALYPHEDSIADGDTLMSPETVGGGERAPQRADNLRGSLPR